MPVELKRGTKERRCATCKWVLVIDGFRTVCPTQDYNVCPNDVCDGWARGKKTSENGDPKSKNA